MRLLVVALCAAALASCAVARPTRKSAAPEAAAEAAPGEASGGAPTVLPDSKRDQILELERQIDTDRATLTLPELAPTDWAGTQATPMGALVPTDDPKCRPGKSETCASSCTLSTSICKNADSICRLAVEMNDDWARGKCAKANKSCEQSRIKCCGCQ